jgi:hypothetical protein
MPVQITRPIQIIQPDSIETTLCDGIFIKSMVLHRKFTLVPQHSHTFDHVTMLATGSVRVWKDDELVGDFQAPHGILIEARTFHKFLSLEDNTTLYCIHHLHDTDGVEIHAENGLKEIDYAILEGVA